MNLGKNSVKTLSVLKLSESDLDEHMLCNSFPYFCNRLGQTLGTMHREWIDTTLRCITEKKNLAIQSARGHFKTSIMSVAFPIWITYRSPQDYQQNIGIIAATQPQSGGIMDIVKTKITNIPFVAKRLLPARIHDTRWSDTWIRTKNGHNIWSLHLGESVRSKHFDYVICDDILKVSQDINIKTVSDLYWSVVYPTTRTRKGVQIVVGTPASYTDIFSELREKTSYISLKYPAVITDPSGNWLRPQLPEIFNLDELKEMKETMPSEHWARECMCEPLTSDTAMFPADVIRKSIDLYEKFKPLYEDESFPRYMGCDIAVSKAKRADWNVFTVLGKLTGLPVIVRDMFRQHLDTDEAVDKIVEMQRYHHCIKMNVEKTGVGWGVAEKCFKHPEMVGVVNMFDTKRGSKEQILGRLEVAMRNGDLAIPNNDILVSELKQFAYKITRDKKVTYEGLGKHDDTVISLALAYDAACGTIEVSASLV